MTTSALPEHRDGINTILIQEKAVRKTALARNRELTKLHTLAQEHGLLQTAVEESSWTESSQPLVVINDVHVSVVRCLAFVPTPAQAL